MTATANCSLATTLITEAFYCHHLQSVVEQLQSRHWHHILTPVFLNTAPQPTTCGHLQRCDWWLVPNKQHHLQIRSPLTTPSCPPAPQPGPRCINQKTISSSHGPCLVSSVSTWLEHWIHFLWNQENWDQPPADGNIQFTSLAGKGKPRILYNRSS